MKRLDYLQSVVLQKELRENFVKNGFIFFPEFLNEEEIALVKIKI